MSQVKKWSKKDTIGLLLGYIAMISFISWIVEGIIKSIGWIGLIVPIGIAIPLIILIVFIFRDSPNENETKQQERKEPEFDYSQMGASKQQSNGDVS